MKKFITLIFALLVATAAAVEYEESGKITQQVLTGSLNQQVYAGDDIAKTRILYTNIEEGKYQPMGFSDLGLTVTWEHTVCEISGQIKNNIATQTVKAYILVEDNEGKFAKTEFTFDVLEKPFSLTWIDTSGNMNQSVKAGETIKPIDFHYDGMDKWGVTGLPPGLLGRITEEEHTITITGTVEETVESGDYEYKVIIKSKKTEEQDDSEEKVLSGTISVEGKSNVTSIRILENEKQKVTAGDDIKPITFEFANVRVTQNLENFNLVSALPASLNMSVKGGVLTVSGTVAENAKDSTYSLKVIVKGDVNNDSAFVSIEVNHESGKTGVYAAKNATMNGLKIGYSNNMLIVASPTSSMVHAQVFDLTGHLIESLTEPVMGSKSISLAHLTKGNYLVRIENGNLARTAKITVR